jgi:hypothetical protein
MNGCLSALLNVAQRQYLTNGLSIREKGNAVKGGTSPSREDGPIRKEICVLSNRKMERLCERLVGYNRFVGEHAYRQLTELYRAPRLYVNCFQPSMKLQPKLREEKKVRYVYDPAKTLLQRLLLSGVLAVQKQQELIEVAQALDPIRLFQQLEQLQQAVFRCAVNGCPPPIEKTAEGDFW